MLLPCKIIYSIQRFQGIILGHLLRKRNYSLKDNFTEDVLRKMLDSFIHYRIDLMKLDTDLENAHKKIRLPNFPSEISENIVKFAIRNKYKICPKWDTKSGDLELLNKKIEVKAFSSDGPSSFGPDEKWSMIYFIDCKDYLNKNFIVYEINLSNHSLLFSSLKMNKIETYRDQCNQKRRPRICFYELQKQIPKEYCKIIFNGNINNLICL
jgi:hypothetical protein